MWGAGLATERAAPITQNEQNAGLFFLYDVDQFFLSFFFFNFCLCIFGCARSSLLLGLPSSCSAGALTAAASLVAQHGL